MRAVVELLKPCSHPRSHQPKALGLMSRQRTQKGFFFDSITADIDNNNMVQGNSSMLAKDAAKGESRVFRLEQKDISASA